MSKLELNLLGKEYLTESEAAHYCGVSESQFRKRSREYGLVPGVFMGKKLFRRTDLQVAIERSWQRYAEMGSRGS